MIQAFATNNRSPQSLWDWVHAGPRLLDGGGSQQASSAASRSLSVLIGGGGERHRSHNSSALPPLAKRYVVKMNNAGITSARCAPLPARSGEHRSGYGKLSVLGAGSRKGASREPGGKRLAPKA